MLTIGGGGGGGGGKRDLISRQNTGTTSGGGGNSGGADDLTSFYLTTGLAAIAAFWIQLYILIFAIFRKTGDDLGSPEESATEREKREQEEKQDKKNFTICGLPCGIFLCCFACCKGPRLQGLRRFGYRAGRIFVFVEFWLLLGIVAAVTMRAMSQTPSTGLYRK